jgi:hypothetical protein
MFSALTGESILIPRYYVHGYHREWCWVGQSNVFIARQIVADTVVGGVSQMALRQHVLFVPIKPGAIY